MARAEGVNLLGWVKEEGLDVMRPLGIFLENCRSFSAWEIWAIWINRVKLHIGSDAVAQGSLASPKELQRAADRCTKAFSRRCIPSLPWLSRHGQCCRCFSSSSPSICLHVRIRRQGGSVGLGSTPGIWHVCAGRGSLSPNGSVLISSHGKEESSVACRDAISPSEERCSWASSCSHLWETGARSWGRAWIPSMLVVAHDAAGSSFPCEVCGHRGTGNTS